MVSCARRGFGNRCAGGRVLPAWDSIAGMAPNGHGGEYQQAVHLQRTERAGYLVWSTHLGRPIVTYPICFCFQ